MKLGGRVLVLVVDELTPFISLIYFLLLIMVNVGEMPPPKSSSRLTLSKPSIERSSKGEIPADFDGNWRKMAEVLLP